MLPGGSVVVVSRDHRSPWDLIKEQLQAKLSAESFENWILRTRFAGIDGKTMVVTAPDRQTAAYLLEEYGSGIDAMAATLGLGLERVQFSAEPASRSLGMPGASPSSNAGFQNGDGQNEIESPFSLNPKFTFESFVVGACNQFAHAAAQ